MPTKSEHPKLTNSKKDGKKPIPPPVLIEDRELGLRYSREGDPARAFLGEGGFARVYSYTQLPFHPSTSSSSSSSHPNSYDEGKQQRTTMSKDAQDAQNAHIERNGTRQAVKVVPHDKLGSCKKRTKLYCEIKIQSMMNHPHIVTLNNTFQDDQNIYLCLEECAGGNMMSLLRKRLTFSEPEAKVYMTQLVSAVLYMHEARVMHRDLKLGNVFVMDKGEKGLYCKVGDFGLAALLDKDSDRRKTMCGTPNYIAPEILVAKGGHSYEVDIWSLGVIMYTMLVGKTPFQEKSVEGIYDNIKVVKYAWPADCEASPEARDLIKSILSVDPKLRPTLNEMLHHPWFSCGPIPTHVPSSALLLRPEYQEMSREQIKYNFAKVKKRAGVGAAFALRVPAAQTVETSQEVGREIDRAVKQQEAEYQTAIQPGSPISALLRSARKPPVVAPVHMPRSGRGESNLLPKFQALQKQAPRGSPLRNEAGRALASQSTKLSGHIREEDEDEQDRRREDKRNVLLPSTNSRANGGDVRPVQRSESDGKDSGKTHSTRRTPYDKMVANLSAGIKFRETGERVKVPSDDPIRPRDFIACWLDYAHKYGMGYALTDGSIGVQFNDDNTMVLAPNKRHIDLIRPFPKDMADPPRESLRANAEPADKQIRDRKFLLNHFEAFMEGKLHAGEKYCEKDDNLNTGMSYMAQYWRLQRLIAFRMSSGFNFHDHTKLVLSDDGLTITYIDDQYNIWTWHLASLIHFETKSEAGSRERRRMESAWKKLTYARDVVAKLDRDPSATQATKAA